MHKTRHQTTPGQNIPRSKFKLLTSLILLQIVFTGCASESKKDNSVKTILEREIVLIEKLKSERSSENIQQSIKQDPSLEKAETHLMRSLEQIQKSNQIINDKILRQAHEENENGNTKESSN